MTPLRILGIDPGTLLTGYACVESGRGRDPSLVEAGVLRLAKGESLSFRLRQLEEDLVGVIEQLQPVRIVVEKVFIHPVHPATAIVMAHARGVVLLVAERAGLKLVEVTPTEVKKSLTGKGHASKRQVQVAVTTRCGLEKPPTPNDVADAIAIALCGAFR
ncbi:MAG: crossover junction endodeoxyribonuclease RuvC [Phycisphaerales bacterium]|nr:crossover junction endodeoxyribonuclease RuvC [Phycisphaerales bacterium]